MIIRSQRLTIIFLLFFVYSFLHAQVDTSWVRRYNQTVCGVEYAYAIATDVNSNICITGWSGTEGLPDYLTIKISASGETLWTRQYNGPANDGDWAYAICVDNQGNVYVTGESDGIGTNSDYATVKYNSNGVVQWAARYNGTGNGTDYATAIGVDNQGNVYVTGTSDGGSSDYDYLTIKYNANGIEQWTRRYNGTGNMDDIANCIAIDGSGNVYVSGESEAEDNPDYLTIKYNTNGVQQWLARYDGIGDSYDYAYAITTDALGNVYVAGASGDIDSDYDYATVKYNSLGAQQWARRYDGTGNDDDFGFWIKVDASGNVYVTGSSYGITSAYDYATVKYNSSGTRQWTTRYNGTGNDNDYAYMLALDNSGNVYVTGESVNPSGEYDFVTVKYNNNGLEQWSQRYQGTGNSDDYASSLAVDALGNVCITGGSIGNFTDLDYLTIKYNTNGVEQWVSRYNGIGQSWDGAAAIKLDMNDNVYVCGSSTGSGTNNDYLAVKYYSNGNQEWAVRYNSIYNGADNPYAMAIDNQANVYLTGESYTTSTNYDILTIKYNTSGNEQWVQRYDNPRHRYDWANAIALDQFNNTYVAGGTDNMSTDYDFITIKYSTTSNQEWVSMYNGSANSIDYANAITVDLFNNVYVTGVSFALSSSYDIVTIKYSPNGETLWTRRYNGPANGSDACTDIKTDQFGNVYVTGRSFGTGTSRDFVTIKYDLTGQELWVSRYNGTANGEDGATALILEDDNNIFVTGWSVGAGTGRDYVTIKYNADGIEQWVCRYNGIGNSEDIPSAISLDNQGNIYVTGASDGLSSYIDYLTIKYNTWGQEQWTHRYNGSKNRNDRPVGIVINNSGNLYITGTSEGDGTANDITTIKYIQTQGIDEIITENNTQRIKIEIFPNPCPGQATIKYALSSVNNSTIQIYDASGRLVKGFPIQKNNLTGEIQWNGTDEKGEFVNQGVYFCIVKSDNQKFWKKLLVVK